VELQLRIDFISMREHRSAARVTGTSTLSGGRFFLYRIEIKQQDINRSLGPMSAPKSD
jgi:hypothetical protein